MECSGRWSYIQSKSFYYSFSQLLFFFFFVMNSICDFGLLCGPVIGQLLTGATN